jgi:hypothetical protein
MTVSSVTAAQLDALGDTIKDLAGPSATIDSQLAALIAEPMLVIEGRTLVNARFTLNVTNALNLRAKKWYFKSLMEIGQPNQPFAAAWFEYEPQLGFVQGGTGTTGMTIGTATCAAICKVWAEIIRRWLAGNYPGTVG